MPKIRCMDYQAVLADLRERRNLIEAAIRAMEAVVALTEPHIPHIETLPPAAPAGGCTHERGAYEGLSLLDAAKMYLQSKGQCQRTKDILRALQDGGIALGGKSPINIVGAVLNTNLKRGGGIVRVRRGVWSLAGWQAQAELPSQDVVHVGSFDAGEGRALEQTPAWPTGYLDTPHPLMPIRPSARPSTAAAHA
jgi:hypothetical protein